MTITLPDDPTLLSLDEARVRLEVACGLFASGRISRGVGARIAGLDRATFDEALFVRHIASYTSGMLDQDLATWETMPKG
jgi:predicted HTH domain antitoxin